MRGYPNPATDRAVISYELARGSEVSCKVYDAAGNHVEDIFDGYQPAGAHSLRWNSSAVSPGVYFCELETATDKRAVRIVRTR